MPIELESKVRVPSHERVRAQLRAAGATYVGRVLETNHIFDREDGSLRRAGCGLRVRSIELLDGEGPGATLTFKGPRQKSGFKRREELEVTIGDVGVMTSVLAALGYCKRLLFQKCRESWRMNDCLVELDEVPVFGTFVEVEGPSESVIISVLDRLELSNSELISAGYVSMLAKHAAEQGGGSREFRLES
ncbi:MAG: class IV adenylate cyclase [Phycisphaerales bacterium]|nr:class IV adenylate cyclase [Phycisphaerales bacterium]